MGCLSLISNPPGFTADMSVSGHASVLMESGDLPTAFFQRRILFMDKDKRSDVFQCVHEISYSRMHSFNEQALSTFILVLPMLLRSKVWIPISGLATCRAERGVPNVLCQTCQGRHPVTGPILCKMCDLFQV